MKLTAMAFIVLVSCLTTACSYTTKLREALAVQPPIDALQRGQNPVIMPQGANMGIVLDTATENANRLNQCNVSHDLLVDFYQKTNYNRN